LGWRLGSRLGLLGRERHRGKDEEQDGPKSVHRKMISESGFVAEVISFEDK
jgi:hypothetical protein